MRMIDADRILRELTALSHGQVWPGWTYEGIRLLIERQPTITPPNEWVSVEERLPEQENTQVLMTDGAMCYISSRNSMVRFLDCEGIFIPGKAGKGVKITHWRPLPAPPDLRPPEGEANA